MKRLFASTLLAALAATALPAAAQFAKPEDAIKYRQAGMTMMAAHFGRVAAMASGRVPFDAKVAAENAELATMLSKLPYAGFAPGTEKGAETRAKADIWLEPDKFRAAASRMQEEMVKLNVAAKAGDQVALKTAAGEVGKACKGCHDTYRRE